MTANNPLAKPGNFEDARETESKCVKFAKEVSAHHHHDAVTWLLQVRRVNKLLGKVEESAKTLASKKVRILLLLLLTKSSCQTTAEQQIEEQRIRFKKVFLACLSL